MKLDDKVREIFVESSLEQLRNVETRILDLEHAQGEERQEQITRIFRAAHSIKGDAGSMGLEHLSRYAHSIENALQLVRENLLPVSETIIDELLHGFDRLRSLIGSPDLGADASLEPDFRRLEALLASVPQEEAVPLSGPEVSPPTGQPSGTAVALPLAPREEAPAEGEAEPQAPRFNADKLALDDKITRVTIPAEQLDILVDRVGELAIAQSRLGRLARSERDSKFLPVAEEIEALCSLLRDQVLGLRLLPLQVSFAKYRRLVRDLCSDLGKKAEFIMTGENTELDKKLIEELNTPLIHLLRNAVDHGIEPPHMREYLGKPAQGNIELSACQLGGEVLIEIRDDGKGIEAQRLRQLAVNAGRLPPDKELSDKELLDLIFLPGLTTAEKVGEVSGRGVGMDAVKASIQSLRGKIEVQSAPGKGTTFRLQLPVSMAIIDCLRVAVAGSDYFMHLDYVEECLELPQSVAQRARAGRSLALRGEHLPLVCLRDFFRLDSPPPPALHVVVVRTNQGRCGVVVDHVVGQHQAVLRQLGPAVGKVDGILGATVTEHGHMGLILDMPSLAQAALLEEQQRW